MESNRRELLSTDEIGQLFLDMLNETIENVVNNNIKKNDDEELDIENIQTEIKNIFGFTFTTNKFENKKKLIEYLKNNIPDRLNEKIYLIGSNNFSLIQKQLIVQILDQQWKAHLLALDQLRQGIGLRAYAQRDPLNEYKREAFSMFEEMLNSVRILSCRFIMLIEFKKEEKDPNKSSLSIRERLRKKNN